MQGRGETELQYTLYCIGHCETVACLGATRQWRLETVACLGATRQRLVWMLKDSASVRCCRTAHCVGVSRQCLYSGHCRQHVGEAEKKRLTLWSSTLVWLVGYKRNVRSPPSTQLASSLCCL
jgi:hypothetical protein